jgi:hypothetical protein
MTEYFFMLNDGFWPVSALRSGLSSGVQTPGYLLQGESIDCSHVPPRNSHL